MPLVPLADHHCAEGAPAFPWKTVVPDEPGNEAKEYVHEPDAPPRDKRDQQPATQYLLNNLSTVYTRTSPFRLDLPNPGDHCPWYHLDWSSRTCLLLNQHKLNPEQRLYLRLTDERVKDFPQSFARTPRHEDEYRTMAAMMAMACDHRDLPYKDRLLRCRRIRRFTRSGDVSYKGKCEVRRFCPYCNYLKRQEALLTYVPAYDRGRWYSMTVSSTADLDLDLDELTHSWDAGEAVVKALLAAGHFNGAYWTEEVSLKSLYPEIRVLPHVHILFHAFNEADLEAALRLANEIFAAHFANQTRAALALGHTEVLTQLEPSIKGHELPGVEDMYRWCDYLTKTVRFGGANRNNLNTLLEESTSITTTVVEAYRNAVELAGEGERWLVNVQFEQFLCGLVLMLEVDAVPGKRRKGKPGGERPKRPWVPSRRQRHTLGTLLCGRSERFVGIRPKERPKHRAELVRLRREISAKQRSPGHDGDLDSTAEE